MTVVIIILVVVVVVVVVVGMAGYRTGPCPFLFL
jgi:hypothetical protein